LGSPFGQPFIARKLGLRQKLASVSLIQAGGWFWCYRLGASTFAFATSPVTAWGVRRGKPTRRAGASAGGPAVENFQGKSRGRCTVPKKHLPCLLYQPASCSRNMCRRVERIFCARDEATSASFRVDEFLQLIRTPPCRSGGQAPIHPGQLLGRHLLTPRQKPALIRFRDASQAHSCAGGASSPDPVARSFSWAGVGSVAAVAVRLPAVFAHLLGGFWPWRALLVRNSRSGLSAVRLRRVNLKPITHRGFGPRPCGGEAQDQTAMAPTAVFAKRPQPQLLAP